MRCRGLHGLAIPTYLRGFLFPRSPRIAPRWCQGGVNRGIAASRSYWRVSRTQSTSSTSPSTPAYSLPWTGTLTGYLLCGPLHRRRDGAGTALSDTPQIEQRDALSRYASLCGSSHLLGRSNYSLPLCPVLHLLVYNPSSGSGAYPEFTEPEEKILRQKPLCSSPLSARTVMTGQ